MVLSISISSQDTLTILKSSILVVIFLPSALIVISFITVYTSQLQEVSPSLPATIMMDEDLAESPDDDMSSPHDYTLASPQGYDVDVISPQSAETQDVTSDIEVDV